MGISNLASGLRTGVCTSTTRPTAPYNGQVIYETDSKQTLVWQGSAWVMLTDADTPPGLQLIKTQTIGTAVSSVTVTNAFSSTFDNYRITITGVLASAQSSMCLNYGSSNASYFGIETYTLYSATSFNVANNNNDSKQFLGLSDTVASYSSSFDVFGPYLASRTMITGNYYGRGYIGYFGGSHEVASSYTDVKIFNETGTLTGGTICVYGYRNAV